MRLTYPKICALTGTRLTELVRRAPAIVTQSPGLILIAGLILAPVLGLPIAPAANAAEEAPFPGLRALMDDDQFKRSGLDKLSPKERATLNRWLANHADFELSVVAQPVEETSASTPTGQPKPPTKVVATRIDRKKRAAEEMIRTRIAGKFKGWTGSTIFSLENGQLWRQRQGGKYLYAADSPEVELFKNRLGFWEMRILATGKRVKVSRYRR